MLAIAAMLFGGSVAVSAALTAIMRRVAPRIGLIDRPGGHKQHGRDVPLGGGAAMLATVALAIAGAAVVTLWLGRWPADWAPPTVLDHLPGLRARMPGAGVMLAGAVGLFVLGLIDDYRPLGPVLKLVVESAVVLAVLGLLGQVRAAEFLPAGLSLVITALWVVVIINAINFMDNMDGLAASVVTGSGSVFLAAAVVNGQLFVPALLLVLIGAAVGFLLHNFPPARIFMGDSGSLVLGYFLGLLTVLTTYTLDFAARPAAVLMPLVILAVPLYDTVSVVAVRLAQGRHLLKSDRSHFSHRLLARGLSVRGALATICLATAATGLASIFLMRLPLALAWIVGAQTVCILGIIAILEFAWPGKR